MYIESAVPFPASVENKVPDQKHVGFILAHKNIPSLKVESKTTERLGEKSVQGMMSTTKIMYFSKLCH
jgi:hypothetical protein